MATLREALEVEPANKEVCSKGYVLRPTGNRREVGSARCQLPLHSTNGRAPCLTQCLTNQVLALLEELRIAARVRAGTDQALTELAGLCSRLGVLLRRKGSAVEVVALLKQVPTLLRAIRARQDPGAPEGTMMYVEAPNHDAQVSW